MELAAYPVDLEEQPEGGFTVTFADVPEAITHGRDRDEALQEAGRCLPRRFTPTRTSPCPVPVPPPDARWCK